MKNILLISLLCVNFVFAYKNDGNIECKDESSFTVGGLIASLFGYVREDTYKCKQKNTIYYPPSPKIDTTPTTPSVPAGPLVSGVFIAFSPNVGFFNDNISNSLGLDTYNYNSIYNTDTPNFLNFGIEGRLGLVKTWKVFGIRAYGYYGASFGSNTNLGINQASDFSLAYSKQMNSFTQYYGGIADLMLGFFGGNDSGGYIFGGGGYQINDYTISGEISLGDKVGWSNTDLYTADVNFRKAIGSPVVDGGIGVWFNRRNSFEIGVRYFFRELNYNTNAILNFDNFYSSVFINDHATSQDRYNNAIATINHILSPNLVFTFTYGIIF